MSLGKFFAKPQTFLFTGETEVVYQTMKTFNLVTHFSRDYEDSQSLRSISGKIGEYEITAKKKKKNG